MKFNATKIPYQTTGLFSQLVRDYLDAKGTASEFVAYAANFEGVQKAINARKNFPINRTLLVDVLKEQYAHLPSSTIVDQNIALLLQDNTFVVTTAHQPNIFTGPLYFFYKIITEVFKKFRSLNRRRQKSLL